VALFSTISGDIQEPILYDQLRCLAAFVQAVMAGSFAEAAERMQLTRSAVGKSIARLEHRLGVRLFHRTTRQLNLTKAALRRSPAESSSATARGPGAPKCVRFGKQHRCTLAKGRSDRDDASISAIPAIDFVNSGRHQVQFAERNPFRDRALELWGMEQPLVRLFHLG